MGTPGGVQLVKHETLDLRVVSSSPMLGVEITFKDRWIDRKIER